MSWFGTYGTQMSWFGTYLGSGVTVQYDFGTTGKKQQIYYARFLFIYFEQTVVQITTIFFFHLDVKILNIITLCYIYEICSTYVYIKGINS